MKNKKTIIIGSLLMISVLFLSGCKNDEDKGTNVSPERSSNISSKKKFNLKNLLQKETPIKCVANIEGGKSVTYIKGNEMKTETTIGDTTMISVIKDKDMFSWKKGDSTGQKMNQDCMKELQNKYGQKNDANDFNSAIQKIESKESAGKITCEPVSKIDLNIPTNINFTDQCKILKEQMQKTEQIQKQIQNLSPEIKM